ncbi:hypothetical protein HDU79_006102 [Rhizoclosmatium sp. JEL0117]|nr:hypothetical protein HDU79_006102 [Rhizoclosmatium sp. JEL0117]
MEPIQDNNDFSVTDDPTLGLLLGRRFSLPSLPFFSGLGLGDFNDGPETKTGTDFAFATEAKHFAEATALARRLSVAQLPIAPMVPMVPMVSMAGSDDDLIGRFGFSFGGGGGASTSGGGASNSASSSLAPQVQVPQVVVGEWPQSFVFPSQTMDAFDSIDPAFFTATNVNTQPTQPSQPTQSLSVSPSDTPNSISELNASSSDLFTDTQEPSPSSTPSKASKRPSRDPLDEPGFDVLHATPVASPPARTRRQSSSQESTRGDRFRATDSELYMLTAVFARNPFPSALLREKCAEKLGLTSRQIQFWFQNRRANLKAQGIHVVKPKKGAPVGAPPGFDSKRKRPSLAPLSEGVPFFYKEVPEGASTTTPAVGPVSSSTTDSGL